MVFDPKNIDRFPSLPGVYLMKDDQEQVIYVGKAKSIKQRVKQYFIPGRDGRQMIPFLVAKVVSIETIVVSSEKEALLLENNLIKQHQPRYNALLKDDKTYIALKITKKDRWPTVQIVRYRGKPPKDGLYFGPYTSAYSARQMIDLIHRLFPLRQCSDQELGRRKRPCILYQMKRCIAPCVQLCTQEEYEHQVNRVIKFLKGQDKEVLKELKSELEILSDKLEFEKAAIVYQQIVHIEKTMEVQYVDRLLGLDVDAIGFHRQGDESVIVQLLFRSGKLVGSRRFNFSKIVEEDGELLSSFLLQYYGTQEEMIGEILISIPVEDETTLEEIFSQQFHKKITIHRPQKGEKKVLCEMARQNAEAFFLSQKNEQELREKILSEMEKSLFLSRYPYKIECFDNAHLGGSEAVSSMVVFCDGKEERKSYRTYILKESSPGDDYGSMKEVLTRRYKRAKTENQLPDLIIVDGGKGQLGIALKVLEELNLTGIDVVGVAKEKGRHDKGMTQEKIFLQGREEPILLKPHSPVLLLIQKIRDEAHRVAITFHRKKRSQKTIHSALEDVKGIGKVKKEALLKRFGSLKNILNATDEELKTVRGISEKEIASIRCSF